jgi:anti-anti-sigma factor
MSSTRTHRFFSAAEQNGTGFVTATARDLGVPAIEEFGEELLDLADERAWSSVEVDLRHVAFLGAAALGVFVALNEKLRARAGRLAVRGVSGPLFDVFKLTHLHKLFDIQPRNEPYSLPQSRTCFWPHGQAPNANRCHHISLSFRKRGRPSRNRGA